MSIRRRVTLVFVLVNAVTVALIAASVFNETRRARDRLKSDREAIAASTVEVLANSFKVSMEVELLRVLKDSGGSQGAASPWNEFTIARALSELSYWDDDPLVTKYLDRVFFVRFSDSDVNRFNPRPRFILSPDESATLTKSFLRQEVARAEGIETRRDKDGQVIVYGMVDPAVSPDWGYYFKMNPLEPVSFDPAESVQGILLIAVPSTLLLLLFLYFFFSRLVLQPLSATEEAALRISGGNYDQPLPFADRRDEIGSVARAMNAMMSRLQAYRTRMQGYVDEATERFKRAEQHLVISERLAAMGRIAAGIAHEVNNPLGGILNAIRKLGEKDLNDERRERYRDLAEDAVRRIQGTVQRVLATAPRDQNQVEPVRLSDPVDRARQLISHTLRQEGIAFDVDLAPDLVVLGDKGELSQLFLNLFINACDAAAGVSGARIEVSGFWEGEEVVVQVKDNGQGMDEEVKERLFDLFFTTKSGNRGTGLGLGIVHNIVTGHGGRISVESAPTRGSVFTLRFPGRRP